MAVVSLFIAVVSMVIHLTTHLHLPSVAMHSLAICGPPAPHPYFQVACNSLDAYRPSAVFGALLANMLPGPHSSHVDLNTHFSFPPVIYFGPQYCSELIVAPTLDLTVPSTAPLFGTPGSAPPSCPPLSLGTPCIPGCCKRPTRAQILVFVLEWVYYICFQYFVVFRIIRYVYRRIRALQRTLLVLFDDPVQSTSGPLGAHPAPQHTTTGADVDTTASPSSAVVEPQPA